MPGFSSPHELERLLLTLPSHAHGTRQASSYDLSALTALDRPLRPIFVSPASELDNATTSFEDFVPVVCASASKLAAEADGLERARGFTYVQGAGDDHESWCPKVSPQFQMFDGCGS